MKTNMIYLLYIERCIGRTVLGKMVNVQKNKPYRVHITGQSLGFFLPNFSTNTRETRIKVRALLRS